MIITMQNGETSACLRQASSTSLTFHRYSVFDVLGKSKQIETSARLGTEYEPTETIFVWTKRARHVQPVFATLVYFF